MTNPDEPSRPQTPEHENLLGAMRGVLYSSSPHTKPAVVLWTLTERALDAVVQDGRVFDFTEPMRRARREARAARAVVAARVLGEIAPHVGSVLLDAEFVDGRPRLDITFCEAGGEEIEVEETVSKVAAWALAHPAFTGELLAEAAERAEGVPTPPVDLLSLRVLDAEVGPQGLRRMVYGAPESVEALRELAVRIAARFDEESNGSAA